MDSPGDLTASSLKNQEEEEEEEEEDEEEDAERPCLIAAAAASATTTLPPSCINSLGPNPHNPNPLGMAMAQLRRDHSSAESMVFMSTGFMHAVN